MADRYKEGYNDCNREWKKKIEEKIKEKQLKIELLHPASDCVIIDDLENEIKAYKDLLKKG